MKVTRRQILELAVKHGDAVDAGFDFTTNGLIAFAAALAREQEAPDGAHEALQRMIEDGLIKGPASREDAMLVAKYRRTLMTACEQEAQPASDVREILENYRCTHFCDEDGGLPLSDALAVAFGDKDVGRALEEIELIADALHGAAQPAAQEPKPMKDVALPQPDIWVREDFGLGDFTTHIGYSEEQLRTYGEACAKAAREQAAQPAAQEPAKQPPGMLP
jgi:hypothetical protein